MAFKPIVLTAVMAVALAGPTFAKNDKVPGTSKPAHAGKVLDKGNSDDNRTSDGVAAAAAAGAVLAGILLSDSERATIIRYFQTHPQPVTALPRALPRTWPAESLCLRASRRRRRRTICCVSCRSQRAIRWKPSAPMWC